MEMIVGLEIHVELATKSKMFCACSTEFGKQPNTQCCPVCLGLPGALPVVNKKAVQLGIRLAAALHCAITDGLWFDRKNYFYPDLPKAYQITQYFHPLGEHGSLTLYDETEVRIREIHLEEDAGKLHHEAAMTMIDFNRCGVPLCEIVTEPDLHTSQQAMDFLEELRAVVRYLGVSDAKMEEGSMRVDVNISVKQIDKCETSERVEIKNIGSIREVGKAIEFEYQRQAGLVSQGEQIARETRRWDEAAQCTKAMRRKERSEDYRYIPEPDLPPAKLKKGWVQACTANLPELPATRRHRYEREWGLSARAAKAIVQTPALAALLEATVSLGAAPVAVSNLILAEVLRILPSPEQGHQIPPKALFEILLLLEQRKIGRAVVCEILKEVYAGGGSVREVVEERGLLLITDPLLISAAVQTSIRENPRAYADVKNGKQKATAALLGGAMRALDNKADPQLLAQELQRALKEEKTV